MADRDPLPIRRLEETLINRIAAGEIIQRPASALKELLENSLDAGSTSIRVTVKDGGMKMLQIQDNGCGIRKADLPILAERFTTSKLTEFSDLAKIATYGFRGEALASMSHVSHLSVVTKTKNDSCAWRAHYADGHLVPAKPGQTPEPKPCAGNDGTLITIEDLFFNTPTRLSALRSGADEYTRILDVVTRYAVHNPHVSFVCKKVSSPTPDVSTPSGSDVTGVIRLLYGQSVFKDLLKAQVAPTAATTESDQTWSASAHFTNANYHGRKTTFLLFINHRLVESPRIKRALESIYATILPKGAAPFIYLSLDLPPSTVDVNVHPTKKEVHFLDEEVITERIADVMQETLAGGNSSRTFQYQTVLTGTLSLAKKRKKGADENDEQSGESDGEDKQEGSSTRASQGGLTTPIARVPSQHKVRTSAMDRTIDSMFTVHNPSLVDTSKYRDENTNVDEIDVDQEPATQVSKTEEIKESTCYLGSIALLRQAVGKNKHEQLTEVLEKHTLVGVVDPVKRLSLLQHSTRLYLVNHGSLAKELFYQLYLRQFGCFSKIKLEPAPSVQTLVRIAVDAEHEVRHIEGTNPKADTVKLITQILVSRREMFSEYFSMDISEDGRVQSIPLLLRGYTPNLDKLPEFLMRLGTEVEWTRETRCFRSFGLELAHFYIPGPLFTTDKQSDDGTAKLDSEQWQIKHVLFPCIRKYLVAPKSLLEGQAVVQVASLPDLYKVFERC